MSIYYVGEDKTTMYSQLLDEDSVEYLQERYNVTVTEDTSSKPVRIEFHRQCCTTIESAFGSSFNVDPSTFDAADFENKGDNEYIQYGMIVEGKLCSENILQSFDEDGFTTKVFKTRSGELGPKFSKDASKLTVYRNHFKTCLDQGPLGGAGYFLTVFPALTDLLNLIGTGLCYLGCCSNIITVKRKVKYPSDRSCMNRGEYLAGVCIVSFSFFCLSSFPFLVLICLF